jgi:putative nucleotidyltransferase with HDIG domain
MPVAGVICDVSESNSGWNSFLEQFAAIHPTSLRFLRCGPRKDGVVSSDSPCGVAWLSTELDAASLAEAIARSFQVNAWIPDEVAKKLVARMKRLPSLPTLYNQVTAELASPTGSLEFVGKLISKDPGITAKILQTVNSPLFGLGRQITDPAEGVMFLGAERTKGMLLAADVFLRFDKDACPGFSHDRLWQHSIAVASFATAIALVETKDKKLSELAYTTALLHDVGKLLLAANIPEDYAKVLEQAQRRAVPVERVELEALGATHAELGAAVLGNWGLPFPMLEAIGWHHCPLRTGDQAFTVLTAVHVANALEHERQDERLGRKINHIHREYIERLDLAQRRNAWRAMCGCAPKTDLSAAAEKLQLQREVRAA